MNARTELSPLLDLADAVRAASDLVARVATLDAAIAEREHALEAADARLSGVRSEATRLLSEAQATADSIVVDAKRSATKLSEDLRAEAQVKVDEANRRFSDVRDALVAKNRELEDQTTAVERLKFTKADLERDIDSLRSGIASLRERLSA